MFRLIKRLVVSCLLAAVAAGIFFSTPQGKAFLAKDSFSVGGMDITLSDTPGNYLAEHVPFFDPFSAAVEGIRAVWSAIVEHTADRP
ncbi:MAG: hypothetical protein WDA00_02550 [Eubacteriales bacterium]